MKLQTYKIIFKDNENKWRTAYLNAVSKNEAKNVLFQRKGIVNIIAYNLVK